MCRRRSGRARDLGRELTAKVSPYTSNHHDSPFWFKHLPSAWRIGDMYCYSVLSALISLKNQEEMKGLHSAANEVHPNAPFYGSEHALSYRHRWRANIQFMHCCVTVRTTAHRDLSFPLHRYDRIYPASMKATSPTDKMSSFLFFT